MMKFLHFLLNAGIDQHWRSSSINPKNAEERMRKAAIIKSSTLKEVANAVLVGDKALAGQLDEGAILALEHAARVDENAAAEILEAERIKEEESLYVFLAAKQVFKKQLCFLFNLNAFIESYWKKIL